MLSPEYLILLIMLLVGIVFYKKKWLSWIIIAYMFLLAFCRADSVGTDVGGYQDDFFIIQHADNVERHIRHHFEYGYVWSVLLFKQFSNDYMLFVALSFIPFFWGVLKFIRDNRVNMAFALFFLFTLGFYFFAFNAMRQMWAIGLIVAAFPYLYAKRYVVFAAITIVVAYLFHRSEVMYLLLIPLHYYLSKPEIGMNKKLLYILVIASYSFFYIANTYLETFFISIVDLMPNSEHYYNYIQGESENMGHTTSLMYSLFALILIYVKNEKNHIFETYMYVISIFIYNVFNTFTVYGMRTYVDFNIIAIILISQMISDHDTKYRRLFTLASITLGLGYFAWSFWINNSSDVNPYIFRYHF